MLILFRLNLYFIKFENLKIKYEKQERTQIRSFKDTFVGNYCIEVLITEALKNEKWKIVFIYFGENSH